jgi:hypothetical protein
VVYGYRRPKNLKDLLVRAKLNYTENNGETNQGVNTTTPLQKRKCTRPNCRYCSKINKSGRIKSNYTNREYMAKHNVSCQSNNLIYCITCTRCNKQYVGQTKRRLMDRFQGHYGNIQRNDANSDIAKHFNTNEHKGTEDIEIHIVDFIYLHPESEAGSRIRDNIEVNWIHRLHSQQPMGLNILDNPPTRTGRSTSRNWQTYQTR